MLALFIFFQKVQDELRRTLEQAIEDKINAEDAKKEIENMLIEREMRIRLELFWIYKNVDSELDWNVRFLHNESAQKGVIIDEYLYKINEQNSLIESLNQKIDSLEQENAEKVITN